jgi:FAT domain
MDLSAELLGAASAAIPRQLGLSYRLAALLTQFRPLRSVVCVCTARRLQADMDMGSDTLRTHVKGVLTRNPDWKPSLLGFEVESAWIIGDWNDVHVLVDGSDVSTPPGVMARLLLAIREGDSNNVAHALSRARMVLGNPIVASGGREYRHTYEAVLNLHLVHEVELIHRFSSEQMQIDGARRSEAQDELTKTLNMRLNSTLPSFKTREPILSMRRTAYGIRLVFAFSQKLIDLTHLLVDSVVVFLPEKLVALG